MKAIYDKASYAISKKVTQTYSTSFSLGIYSLSPAIRDHIYAIYGFVRLADEIVDSFEGFNKVFLLEKFREDTYQAIETGISCNPVLNAFQHTVRRYSIQTHLIDTFLESMSMDLNKVNYTPEKYEKYILGSAEVVGIMCLHVFTNANEQLLKSLTPYAMKLGAAFQKINFLRDLKDDYQVLGRVYFPNVNLDAFNQTVKRQIEQEIEEDFKIALQGIKQLPASSKAGVYLAYVYYRSLFKKIKALSPQKILSERVRISNYKKLSLMFNSFVECKMNLI